MCGYFGVFSSAQLNISDEQIIKAKESLKDRNQETEDSYRDNHLWMDVNGANMPLINSRYLVVLDGKIYNNKQIQDKLERKGYLFETGSDIEVIANLFQESGTDCFKELRGKFAIVIWDCEEKILYAARDHFGMKPLYFLQNENECYVASQKKAIMQLQPHTELNKEALQQYFSFQYVPPPMTLANNVYCLEPGHFLIQTLEHPLKKHRYFHASFQPVDGNEKQIINRIQEVLVDSVASHVQKEASIGAFLSGGIDSSLLVGIAREISPSIKTFSVGFEEYGYSEIPLAKETATKLEVENYSHLIQPEEFVEKLPTILSYLDDPLADPASIPLYIAAELAKEHVDVVLSGEGADELFGGYNIYREYESLKVFQKIPETLLRWINVLARIFPDGMTGKSFLQRGTTPLNKRYIGNAKIFEEKEKRNLLKEYDEQYQYQQITSPLFQRVEKDHPAQQMQYIDIHTWLPGDILLKANRMTGAHLLDVRTPFLDKEVFEVAQKIPVKYKLTDNQTKVILRKAAMRFVPGDVIDRKKLGFPVPVSKWLRKELYDWAQRIILESKTEYLLQKSQCLKLLIDHAYGYHDNGRKLWTILVFMLWHKLNIEELEGDNKKGGLFL